jgi:hypothetical protein
MPIIDPVQLFQTVLARMNAEDWAGTAALCDPASLTSFRRTMLDQFAPTERHVVTADDYLKMEPDMPREVAEYNVKHAQKTVDPDARIRSEFPSVASFAALRALEPVDFFAEYLYGRSPQRQLRDQAKDGAISKKAADAIFARPFEHFLYEPVGSVTDGDRIAHVLYRLKMDESTDPRADAWLANVPADEREFTKDVQRRGHPQLFLCRKQPDGGWLGVADFQFVGGGMTAFFEKGGGDEYDYVEDAVVELSP